MGTPNVWQGSIDSDASKSGNWSATRVPQSGDDVQFISAFNNSCSFSNVSSFTCDSFTVDSGYSMSLDMGSCSVTCNGTVNLAGSNVNLGSGSWMVYGNFDCRYASSFNFSGYLYMSGYGKSLYTGSHTIYNLYIYGYTYASGDVNAYYLNLYDSLYINEGRTVTVTSYGSFGSMEGYYLSGPGTFVLAGNNSFSYSNVSISGGLTFIIYDNSNSIPSGYWGNLSIRATSGSPVTSGFASGTPTISGNFDCFDTGNGLTISNSSSNPDLHFRGNVSVGSGVTWTKGTGTITISGSAAQFVDFAGETIEDLTVNKSSGTVNFTEAFTADTFTGTSGHIVFYPSKSFTIAGNMTLCSGCSSNPNGTSLDVNGDFSADGQDWSTVVDTWYLNVAGTSTMANCDVKNCDSQAGSDTNAGRRSTNLGGNAGVTFQNPNIAGGCMLSGVG